MKLDYDKKHPFTSVNLISEGNENEYLTEEQTKEFKKIGLRCVWISYFCVFFCLLSFICEFIDINNLLNASKTEKILAIIGFAGLGCLIVSIVFLFVEVGKMSKLSKKYETENNNRQK